MKSLKKIGFAVMAFLFLILIVALFVEKTVTVSRTIEISRSQSDVFDYVQYLDNQSQYSVWQEKDPKILVTSSGTDGTVGYVSSWKSAVEEVGIGEQEIIAIQDEARIDYELRFKKPMEQTSLASISFESIPLNSTRVTWEFNASSPYPFNIFFLFLDLDKKLGPDLQNGLENLKTFLETPE